ncbi:MAG: tetratricopeptide repeat protein [Pirellulales bacterium]
MATIAEALSIAFAHHQRGEIAEAERIYRQIVASEPTHADAWHLLGVAAHQAGRNDEAVESISRALQLGGDKPIYLNHLGAAYAGLSRLDEAEAAFRKALSLGATDPQVHYNLAALLGLRGRKADAAIGYRRAIELAPKFVQAHFNLGNLLRDGGDLEEAEKCYAAALAAQPTYVKAAMSMAGVQLKLKKHQAAEATYRRVLDVDSTNAEAHYWLGFLLQSQNRLDEAALELQAAVVHNPRHIAAQNNLGCVFRTLGRLDQAEQCFRLALAESPDFAEALSNLGSVLHDRKQYDEAIDSFRRAIAARPDFAQAYNNLGTVHQDQKHFDDALACYHKALEIEPHSAETMINVGSAMHMQGQFDKAVEWFRRAIAADASLPRAYYLLGTTLHFQGHDDDAVEEYAEAIRLKPDYAEVYYNRSFARLSRGDLKAGWQDYEWRLRCKDYQGRRFDAPRWDGSPLEGRTLLVHAEQGLGDTLQFIRYQKIVERLGGPVFFEVQPGLAPLLKASGYTGMIPGGSPLPRFDVQLPLLSLPYALATTLDSIPAEVPYLAADPRLIKVWRSHLRSLRGFKVGIVWQGNPNYTFDHFRSMPLVEFAPLAQVDGVRLVNLQKNLGAEQVAALDGRFTVYDLGSTLDTKAGAFMDTAAVMCNLDLVITSDTAAAHLAGGLGVPVWVALPTAPDWRWMRERPDSPWYPTMRLFRQSCPGDWSSVFAQMKDPLAACVHERSSAG